ncbi:ABC transporter ATP-binding protein [Pseudooceanicola aestuarii]|uniref:iron ABC transporter ATP-binding protein n=1 Tax=Pseudooceanicola aestuarii TaxID=2697319 RepID=UPI0013D7DFF8|nr:ATP-binding cassette domain-containing protein [Pseudooceanicola aestuarii]
MIDVSDLHHSLGGAPVLNGVDLHLPRGGITAMIGPNGAGKSTLLSLIARLRDVQRGRITLDGQDITRIADRDMARRLAVMPQSTQITARLRVADLVEFGRYPWHRGRPGPEDRALVAQALERFDLGDLQTRFLDEISGGQRQRALAAMTFAQSTDYLLLDEPLNNLDIAAARDLMRLLREMADKDGKTILIVIHDINYAAAFADRLVVMKDGRIAAEGSPAEVVTAPLLSETFGTPARVTHIDGRPVVLV